MKVATRIADLTPACEVYLVGYVGEDRKHPAKGVHDTPLAVSLLVQTGLEKYLFVSIDTIAVDDDKVERIKDRIMKVLPLKKDHITINAVHSHSLPNGFMSLKVFDTPENETYVEYVISQIETSLVCMEEDLMDCTMEIGTTKVHGFYSKRTDVKKPFEDNAMMIRFVHDKQIIAAVCNFNCHATVLGPKNMYISSDIIGSVRSRLQKALHITPLTLTGASGDISNRQLRKGNDFEELERVGKGIADILLSIDNYQTMMCDPFVIQSFDYHVSYDNTVFYPEYQKGLHEANEILSQPNISLDEWKMRSSEKAALEMKLGIPYVDFHVRGKVMKSKALTIVTFPGELASKFGLALREQCKTPYFLLIGYSEGYQGYFIEQEEYGFTYETKATNTPKGVSEKIVKEIGELL